LGERHHHIGDDAALLALGLRLAGSCLDLVRSSPKDREPTGRQYRYFGGFDALFPSVDRTHRERGGSAAANARDSSRYPTPDYRFCLVATATVLESRSDGKPRADIVPMHRMRRVRPLALC